MIKVRVGSCNLGLDSFEIDISTFVFWPLNACKGLLAFDCIALTI
jgi:hypothetical protein